MHRIAVLLWCAAFPVRLCLRVDLTTNCWRAIEEEAASVEVPLSFRDYIHMAALAADFVKALNFNEMFFCLGEEFKDRRQIEYIFASATARRGLYFLKCDLDRYFKYVSSTTREAESDLKGTRTSGPLLDSSAFALHLTTRKGFAKTLLEIERQSDFTVANLKHMIVGNNLPKCTTRSDVTGHWFEARYDKSTNISIVEEVFAFADGHDDLHVSVARWKPPLRMTILRQPDMGPTNFKGHVIRVAAITYQPFIMKSSCEKRSEMTNPAHCSPSYIGYADHLDGYLVEIMDVLAKKLNFTVAFNLLTGPTAEFGNYVGGGNYSGLVGLLQRNEADLCLAGFTITDERSLIMDFSGPVAFSSYKLYIQSKAQVAAIGWQTYVKSFLWTTWVAILMLVILATICLWVALRFVDDDPHFNPVINVAFMVFSCTVQQGSWILPKTTRAQMIFWIFWATCVILYAAYTARLTSSLTVSSIKLPFANLKEAARSPGWRVAVQRGTAAIKNIRSQRSIDTTFDLILTEINQDPTLLVETDTEGINRVLMDNHIGYLAEDVVMRYEMRDNCSVAEIPGGYFSGYLHIGVRKNLPYAGILNQELGKLSAGGLLNRMMKQWWSQSSSCTGISPYSSLGFENILTAFLLLLAGGGLACVFLLLEMGLKDRSCLMSLSGATPDPLRKIKRDLWTPSGKKIAPIFKKKVYAK